MKTFIIQVNSRRGSPCYRDGGSVVSEYNTILWHGSVSVGGLIASGSYVGMLVGPCISIDDTCYAVNGGHPAADCIAIPPEDKSAFFANFTMGEKINIILSLYGNEKGK